MNKMELGLIVGLDDGVEAGFRSVVEAGVPTCQLSCVAERLLAHSRPQKIRESADRAGVRISSVFLLFEGQVWNRHTGAPTMGLVPEEHRDRRLELALAFSDRVKDLGVNSITCHMGFIPDDPADPLYKKFVSATRILVDHCRKNNQIFCFETGQELPSTLMRTLRDVGLDNAFVNLDPANLILYGMAHPLDAVEIFGDKVRQFHAKDALWPNRDEGLGIEVPLGEGEVRIGLVLEALKKHGFTGPVTIEREIRGEQQRRDIEKAKTVLEPYLVLK